MEQASRGDALVRATFAELLRQHRRRELLSQELLAERAGLSARTIRSLEDGRNRRPRSSSVRLLIGALELSEAERASFLAAARQTRRPVEVDRRAAAPAVGAVTAVETVSQRIGVGGGSPSQLPPAITDFVGRAELIEGLHGALAGERTEPVLGMPIAIVTGPPGVGKTALALQVAHRLRGDFPDGQLWVDLRGAQRRPLDPAEVLASFLRAFGVDGAAIPGGTGERAGLYRTLLAGRSVLVVLDNAAGEEQVRSLLPGDGGCGALLTSRAPLAGIEGAHMIGVGVLSAAQGIELLSRIAGRDRVAADPHAAEAIVASCGRLPLALRVAGARLAGRPWWSLAQLGERLADEHKRLDELVAGDLAVRASLALSYQSLAGDSQRLFRLLACLDAPNVGGWVAAALLDTDLPGAERLMEALVDVHLLEIAGEGPPGWLRYRFHDLVRVFARERAAAARELGEEQPAALGRALSGWLALAEQADRRLPSNVYGVGHGRAPRWRLAAATTDSLLADPLAWLDAERVALVAVVGQAADAGLDELAADLAASLVNFLDLRRYFDDWQRSHDAALAVSRRRGNRRGEASLLRGLGYLSLNRNSLDAAMNCLGRAHRILGQIGDRRGKAQAVEGIGVLHRLQGRYAEAASCYDQAMAAFLDLGDRHGEAWTRFAVGVLHDERGELAAALAELTRALALFGELGELRGAAWTQRRLGVVYSARGDLDCAAAWLERALAGLRGLGDRAAEACTLRSLGELHLRGDARDKARRLLQDSLAIASDLDDRFFEAQVLRSLGDLHHLEANQAEAARCLNRSAEIWRQLDMPSAGSDARALILSTLYPAADPAGFLPTRPGGPWRRPELAAAAVMISCLFRNGGNVRRGRKPVSVWHGGRTAAVRPCGGELSRHAARGRRFHDRGGFPVIVTGRSPRS